MLIYNIMTWGIFKSISRFGKKLGRGVVRFGKKMVHEIPKAVHWVRAKAAPVIKKFAHIQGDVAGALAVPLGVATGQPELTAGLKPIQTGSKVAEKLADEIEIKKKHKKHDNPKPF
jgi:hypothetical protein